MAEGDAKRWFKYGCFGCLGCLGLILIVIALMVGTAWLRSRSETVEDRVLTHPTPAETAPRSSRESVPEPTGKAPGKVILDLSGAEFHVEPGPAGDPIRVQGTFDRNSYALEESTGEAKDGTWTYSVEFHPTKAPSWLMDALRQVFSASKPIVRVTLPRDVPIALETRIERGGLIAELGGLRLTSADFHVSMAGLEVSVSEPLAEPMERLDVTAEMGGGEFRSLGNASPRVLDVKYSMGGMQLDLSGAWQADADISLRGSMGGAEVRLPKDVRIEGVKGWKFEGPPTGELKVPTLRFSTSSEMGNVEFK